MHSGIVRIRLVASCVQMPPYVNDNTLGTGADRNSSADLRIWLPMHTNLPGTYGRGFMHAMYIGRETRREALRCL